MKETKCPQGYSMEYIKENFGLTNEFSKCSGCELFSHTGDECCCDLLILDNIKNAVVSCAVANTYDFDKNKRHVTLEIPIAERVSIDIQLPEEENIKGE